MTITAHPDRPTAPAILQALVDIAAALAKAGISKDRKNQQQGYAFRGVEDVYAALSPLLAAHHVVVLPDVLTRVESSRETKSGGTLYSVVVHVRYTLRSAKDGSSVEVATWGEGMDSADKATNKAISSSYKYMAFTTFCIPVEGQDDADATTPEESAPAPRRAPAKKKDAAPATAPYEFVEDAVAALDAVTDAKELPAIAERIKVTGFQGADLELAKEAYARRKRELQQPPKDS